MDMSQNESQVDIQDFDDNIMTKLASVWFNILFICISANFGLLRKWTMHHSHPNFSFAYLLTVPRKLISFLTCVGLHPGFRVRQRSRWCKNSLCSTNWGLITNLTFLAIGDTPWETFTLILLFCVIIP